MAVETVPPLFAAGVRFSIAGTILYLWARTRGADGPSGPQWRSLTILGVLMFLACLVVVASQVAWSVGTVLTPTMTLPRSNLISAGGQMMARGAMLLACSVALGEVPPLPHISPEAAAAIAYLIVAGSLIAFTAYEWLLTQVSATKVTSCAYVNPVVALILGHEIDREPIGVRTIVGCTLVLTSTIALLRRREPSR